MKRKGLTLDFTAIAEQEGGCPFHHYGHGNLDTDVIWGGHWINAGSYEGGGVR